MKKSTSFPWRSFQDTQKPKFTVTHLNFFAAHNVKREEFFLATMNRLYMKTNFSPGLNFLFGFEQHVTEVQHPMQFPSCREGEKKHDDNDVTGSYNW